MSSKALYFFVSICFLCLVGCLPSTETGPYSGGLEMWEEPRHKLVFSTDDFKVMDVTIPAGDTCQFHIHRHPTIYVLLNGAKYATQNWKMDWEHIQIADLTWAGLVQDMTEPYTTSEPNVYHRVTIQDDDTYRLIAIANTGEGTQDGEESGSLVNSNWFKENRFEIGAQEESSPIKLKYPSVLIQYTDGATSIMESGVEHSFKTELGNLSWHEAGSEFSIMNKSDETQEFVAIELK